MALYQLLTCVLLAASCTGLPAQSNTSTDTPDACDPAKWIQCLQPVIFLGFSGLGGSKSAKLSQTLTPVVYNIVCSTTRTFISCGGDYMSRCDLATTGNGTPQTQSNVQLVSRAMSRLVSSCDNADDFSRFKKTVTCAEKTGRVHTCWTAAQASFPEDERETSPTHIYSIKNPQKNVCCMVNQFKACIAPAIQSSCSVDEKGAANDLMKKVLEAFECTSAVYQTCSS